MNWQKNKDFLTRPYNIKIKVKNSKRNSKSHLIWLANFSINTSPNLRIKLKRCQLSNYKVLNKKKSYCLQQISWYPANNMRPLSSNQASKDLRSIFLTLKTEINLLFGRKILILQSMYSTLQSKGAALPGSNGTLLQFPKVLAKNQTYLNLLIMHLKN